MTPNGHHANGHSNSTGTSPVPLTFIIVGGNIAGLASAYALSLAGHRAIVLEASSGKRRGCGPTRSPPNMTKIFERWGLGPALRARAIVCSAINMRDGESGECMGGQRLIRPVMSQFGADFLALAHGDVLDLLREAALRAGATLRTMTPVVAVESKGAAGAVVVLESGERVRGDVVIGADGAMGVMRGLVVGHPMKGQVDERYVYNFALPLDALRRDPDLRHLVDTSDWQIFMGNNCCLQSCASPARGEYLVVLKAPTFGDVEFSEGWDKSVGVDAIQLNMDGLGAIPRKLVRIARQVVPTVHCVYEPFEQWLNEDSTVVLVGDAAHPQVPSGSQACAMAIEDAHTLGELFSRLSHRSQTASLLSAYEDIRQARCAEIQDSERNKTDFVCLPLGNPLRAARDAGTRAAAEAHILELEDADEEVVAANWGDYVMQWAHDAGEAVDDWWTKWGTMFDRAGGSEPEKTAINVHLQVSSEIKHTWD